MLMLDLAQQEQPIDLEALLGLHRAVVGSVPYAGQWRDHAVYIRGSLHVPPNYVTLPQRLAEMMQTYGDRRAHGHAVEAAATLHFELLTIHPFADGTGRTARLVANLALIQAGYAPILIGPADKPRYFDFPSGGADRGPGVRRRYQLHRFDDGVRSARAGAISPCARRRARKRLNQIVRGP